MTKEDAVLMLEQPFYVYTRSDAVTRIHEARQMALDALKKTIPEQPDYWGDGYDPDGQMIVDAHCPECGCEVEEGYHKICPECGQWLKWE